MRERIGTEWRLYGESGIPGWLVVLAALIGGYWMLRWLREERRRDNLPARLLPVTGALLMALSSWLVWKPAWVRIDQWSCPSEVLAVLDESSSMDLPMAGGDLTSRLDILGVTAPEDTRARSVDARDLSARLGICIEQGELLIRSARRGLDEREQSIPPGPASQSALDEGLAWLGEIPRRLLPGLEHCRTKRREADRAGAVEEEPTSLSELTAILSTPVPSVEGKPDIESLPLTLRRTETVTEKMRSALPPLQALQAKLDRRFLDAGGSALAKRLEEAALVTRSDVSRLLLSRLDTAGVVSTAPRAMDRESTDLYGSLARAMNERGGRSISDVILLSDGGQNAPVDEETPRRLSRAGIALHVVGVGLPATEPDLAILDWNLPSFAVSGEEVTARVRLKMIPGREEPVPLELRAGDTVLASAAVGSDGSTSRWATLRFPAPPVGRHGISLEIMAQDADPGNNRIHAGLDVRPRAPRALLVANEPNWDTVYWVQAARAAGIGIRQVHSGIGDEAPARGSGQTAIPDRASQWSRYDAIVLQGSPFQGFADEDAQALWETVVESGRSLLVFAGEPGASYPDALATRFGWEPPAGALPVGAFLTTADEARTLPMMRVGADGASSRRLIEAMGKAKRLYPVSRQQLPLLLADGRKPVLSLGFYGRGKVLLCGIQDGYRFSEYANSETLSRLLTQWMADLPTPVAMKDDGVLAAYPFPAIGGHGNVLIRFDEEDGDFRVEGGSSVSETLVGRANRYAVWTPETAGTARVSHAEASLDVHVVKNPGLEQMDGGFDEALLKNVAEASGGRYVDVRQAGAALAELSPASWQSETVTRRPLADHWIVLTALAGIGTLHWVLRKASGLGM